MVAYWIFENPTNKKLAQFLLKSLFKYSDFGGRQGGVHGERPNHCFPCIILPCGSPRREKHCISCTILTIWMWDACEILYFLHNIDNMDNMVVERMETVQFLKIMLTICRASRSCRINKGFIGIAFMDIVINLFLFFDVQTFWDLLSRHVLHGTCRNHVFTTPS